MSKLKCLEYIEVTTTVSSDFYRYASGPEKAATRHKRLYSQAEDLKKQIQRHCDFDGNIEINEIFNEVCKFCAAPWTEDSDDYNGGCCDKDIENNPEE